MYGESDENTKNIFFIKCLNTNQKEIVNEGDNGNKEKQS